MQELENQIDSIEVGDTIEWTEDWDTSTKTFVADVVAVEKERRSGTLTKPARLVAELTLDVVEGDRENVDPSLKTKDRDHAVVSIEKEV